VLRRRLTRLLDLHLCSLDYRREPLSHPRLRFGLGGQTPHTLEEIGQRLEVTRERIRQIETQALAKLRRPRIGSDLRVFVEN
jgi:RNA polymerase nonessential primary-like sigma factor